MLQTFWKKYNYKNGLSPENMGIKYTYCQFHLRKVMLIVKTTKDFRIEKDYANLKVHIVWIFGWKVIDAMQ